MAANLSVVVSAIFILIASVGHIKCGRFPTRNMNSLYQIKDGDDYTYKSESSLEDYFNGRDTAEEDAAAYITDVQIDELQNAQEKGKQDQAIFHIDPRCPKFNGDCSGEYTCDSDNECGSNKICCFNGCIQTCVYDMSVSSPPIEIHWIPQDQQNMLEYSFSGTNRVITIPGGCRVSDSERQSLDLFLKYGHVTKCLCRKEDVVCYVRNNAV